MSAVAVAVPTGTGYGGTVVFDGGDMQVARPSGFDEYKSASAQIDLNAPLTYTGWRLTPEKGSTTDVSAFPYNTQYVYRGRWHLADAGIYSFAKYFDDGGYLAIDGVPLIWLRWANCLAELVLAFTAKLPMVAANCFGSTP